MSADMRCGHVPCHVPCSMSADMRCGHVPCDGFYPLRYYADKLRVDAPYVRAAYTVLGIAENESSPAINPKFLRMTIDFEGKPLWWKTDEGESRCSVDAHCRAYYLQVKQILAGNRSHPFMFSGISGVAKHLDVVASERVNQEHSLRSLPQEF